MNARPLPPWLISALVGCAYLAGGYAVARLRVEADYPLAFWPSAGIALAACLRWGRGVLPGVAAGAFLLAVWLRLEAGSLPDAVIVRSLVGALATLLQTAVGAWAVRRGLGFPNELGRGRDVVAFWLLGGVLSTWIAPATMVMLLAGEGGFAAAVLARTFALWWLGQMLGVMVFAPVVLALVMPREGAWRSRPLTVAVPVTVALAGTLMLLDLVGVDGREPIGADLVWRSYPFQAWALLTAGLVLCAVFAALLLVLSARSAMVLRLVEQRTAELDRYNAKLKHEITERRRTEEQLRDALRIAGDANQAKSEFLGTISHELRTPLNAVLGMTELALDTELDAEQRGYLLAAQTAGRQLLRQIGSLLDFAQVAAGRLRVRSVPYSLRELLASALAEDSERARAKGLRLHWQVAPDVPDALLGDPLRLREILLQLVDNAIKFTPRGRIEVTARRLASSAGEGARLVIEVADTGIGMPPARIGTIFDPFHQLDGASTRRFGGTGVGLSLCRELALRLGGELVAESAGEGQGSRLRCTLPLLEAPSGEAIGPGTSALVMADSLGGRRALVDALERLGLATVTAGEPEEALALLERSRVEGQPFRLLLLDIEESVERAFTWIETLYGLLGGDAPRVMLLTASGIRGDAARCRTLGIAAYLTKPVTLAELRETVLVVLGGPQADTLITRHSLRERRTGRRVLLAVADAAARAELAPVLEAHGCRVTTVGDAVLLRALCSGRNVDAVVLDWDAALLEPEAAVHSLVARAARVALAPRVIAVSAFPAAAVAGVDLWLPAPLSAAGVLAGLEAVAAFDPTPAAVHAAAAASTDGGSTP